MHDFRLEAASARWRLPPPPVPTSTTSDEQNSFILRDNRLTLSLPQLFLLGIGLRLQATYSSEHGPLVLRHSPRPLVEPLLL